ncbi:hypothetical protein BCR44DRAFT_50664 [Catenaria anguillulae PL171]|uniref:Secreted protein n=1 Tax=Catenaria anguillulae PL171 TaxID=765915 RepID=A0A1Y2HV34_9FUNG|nr:hypothetical protein BCR44DRAFT_50664 [Catenaria anguillulae PL171]
MMLHQLFFLITVLSVATAITAQDNAQPTFINPVTGKAVDAKEAVCLAKLDWPKCHGWNFHNSTIKDDPGFKRREAQICTPECQAMKSSLSREYDESGRSCLALQAESWEAAQFQPSMHRGPDGKKHVPWSVIPKDYACSSCILQEMQVEKQLNVWYANTFNIPEPVGNYDGSDAALQERAQICKDWKAPGKSGSSSPVTGGAVSRSSPALSMTTLGSTIVLLAVACL